MYLKKLKIDGKSKINIFKFQYGPWAIVAGASEGLGAAFAESLAYRGLNLVLLARRKEKLMALSEKLSKEYGVEIIVYALDLGDIQKLREFYRGLNKEIGLLVYNAAFAPIGSFEDRTEEDLLKIIDVNIKAPLIMVKKASEKMILQKKGGIILMSSLSGYQGSPKISTYAASKAFNTILAEGLWKELKENNIDVLSCISGAVRTPGYQQAQGGNEAPGILDASSVVESTLNSLGRGPTIVPGALNKIFSFILTRIVPVKIAIGIMYKKTKELS
ncbi:MAG: SDR family NAD(P)-dependent oxidoreductase [Spirochaetaceae bacterium]|nr:SDR family NAD(P)-dependent oxidoreductase [Spirochaetaceae bacterium]